MSYLCKTNALVLSKLNYGDTSKIVTLYTEDYGKETCIIKGARSSKSKIGGMVDLMNQIQIVFYKKDSREVQIISQADLISHFPHIKESLDSLKYGSGVIELLKLLTIENEVNKRLFKGSIKILEMMNTPDTDSQLLFLKYFTFFIDELGYSVKEEECKTCRSSLNESSKVFFNYEKGFLCENCGSHHIVNYEFDKELFKLFICLSSKQNDCRYTSENLKRLITFLEKFLKYHLPEFKGIKSLYTY
ncbi:MAG: DNA repair protein RecO [Melioribacteraceae bacterium]|nr:DNA repair protein RecO [Melioribacteraceae bacterium]